MSQASPPVAPSAPPAVEEEIKSSDPIQTPAVAAVNAEPEGSVQEVPQQSPQQLPARTDTATFMGRLTQRQLTDLKRAFDRFDTDKSGSIDAAELAFILKALGQTPTQGELLDMLNEVDQDGNGTIEFDEFCRMMVQRGPSAGVDKEDTLEAFRVFDSEGNGKIPATALRKALTSLGERFSDWEFEQWLKQIGLTMEGELDYVQYIESLFAEEY